MFSREESLLMSETCCFMGRPQAEITSPEAAESRCQGVVTVWIQGKHDSPRKPIISRAMPGSRIYNFTPINKHGQRSRIVHWLAGRPIGSMSTYILHMQYVGVSRSRENRGQELYNYTTCSVVTAFSLRVASTMEMDGFLWGFRIVVIIDYVLRTYYRE